MAPYNTIIEVCSRTQKEEVLICSMEQPLFLLLSFHITKQTKLVKEDEEIEGFLPFELLVSDRQFVRNSGFLAFDW